MEHIKEVKRKSRRRRVSKIEKEIPYDGTYHYIKELNLRIKIRDTKDIKRWIIEYCKRHPFKQKVLYQAYNINE